MKRLATLTIAMGIWASAVVAQSSFTFTPSDTVIQDIPDDSYTQIYIYQENQTNDSLTLGVEIVAKEIPASWDGMVCIYGFCLVNFPVIGFTSEMAPIHDTINGYVRVTANPLGSMESASISVRVFNTENPMDGDTCTFILNPETNTSIADHDVMVVNVYPNPAVGLVSVTAEKPFDAVRIISMDGKTVWTDAFASTDRRDFSVDQLPTGTYFIELSEDATAVARKRLTVNE